MMIAVFRSRLLREGATEFQELEARLLEIARGMPGFVSYRNYVAEDGERCSVVAFDSRENLQAWRQHPEHQAAQRIGRERYYEEYSLEVAEVERESAFKR